MKAAGCYPGMTMADYMALPAVSAGVIKAINERCPRAAWFESHLNPARQREHSAATDAGSIAHSILLEGSIDCVTVIDPEDYPAANGNVPNGWTNNNIRTARDNARAAGKIPVLIAEMTAIAAMVDSAIAYIDSLKREEPAIWAAFQPDGGESELTMVWDENGTLCRARADRISNDRTVIVDVKTTAAGAEPIAFSRQFVGSMGYATSAGFYRRATRRLFNVDTAYAFLVIETEPPYLCSLVGLDPPWQAFGDSRAAIGLQRWQACASTNHFPGYATRCAYPEMPAWQAARFEEEQMEAAAGLPYDPAVMFGTKEAA